MNERAKKPGLARLPSGLLIPAQAATAATPQKDEAAQPPEPVPQMNGVMRSKQQAILDAPVKLESAVINVIMKTAYSFHFNRKTGVVQMYRGNRESRRAEKLERRREERRGQRARWRP